MIEETEILKNKCIGVIGKKKVTKTQKLIGSEIELREHIEITISHGSIERPISKYCEEKDRYREEEQILTIKMTKAQFVAFAHSSDNELIPCTIDRIANKQVPFLDTYETRIDFLKRKYTELREAIEEKRRLITQKRVQLEEKYKTTHKNKTTELLSISMEINRLNEEIEKILMVDLVVMEKSFFEALHQAEQSVIMEINANRGLIE